MSVSEMTNKDVHPSKEMAPQTPIPCCEPVWHARIGSLTLPWTPTNTSSGYKWKWDSSRKTIRLQSRHPPIEPGSTAIGLEGL
ncbi:hypothetical protein TNCV_4191391 [Trichonephila clavipes]|nr:hypothetical protein TNCV_4191391 [Trichonephila clavipes]